MSCQEDYAYSINTIPPLKYQSSNKESSITSETVTSVRSLAGILYPILALKYTNSKVHNVIELNNVIKCIKSKKNRTVFHHLNLSSIALITYTDASFNNLPNGGSQGGQIVFLTSNGKKCYPLAWNSNRVKV